jgi:hypothetical protein
MANTKITTNVIADDAVTSDKLGGDLTMPGHVSLADNKELRIGTGNDLVIKHDGSHTTLTNTTGNFTLLGDAVYIGNAANNEYLAQFIANGACSLRFNNTEELATVSGGVYIPNKLGIGVNAPSYQLDVRTASGNWGVVHSDGTRKVATYIDTNGNDGLYTINSMPLTFGTGGTAQVQINTAGTLRVGNPAGVPTPTNGWDANLDAIQVGEASAFRSGDSDYSAATVMSTNLYQTGGGDKLLNGTDYAAQYTQQGGNHYFYGYDNGSADAVPGIATNDLMNPLIIHKGGGLQIGGGTVANTVNGKAGIFWHGNPANGADYCIRRTNDAWSGSNYAQLLIDWDTGVKIDVGNAAYGKSWLEVNGPITTFADGYTTHDYDDLSNATTRGISVNLHPSLACNSSAVDHVDNARNLGLRALVHQSTTSSTNRPTGYGTIWCDQHYYSDLNKGGKYVMQKCVGHSSTPLEYRRNTDTANGTSWSSWYTVDHSAVSDIREKKNIVDAPDQLENLKKIRVRKFDFKNDLDPDDQLGMIAQELDTTLPEYVWKQHDKDTGEVIEDLMWRIRYKDMIPMLIKSIQEQQALIETLQAEVKALKEA